MVSEIFRAHPLFGNRGIGDLDEFGQIIACREDQPDLFRRASGNRDWIGLGAMPERYHRAVGAHEADAKIERSRHSNTLEDHVRRAAECLRHARPVIPAG